MLPFAYTTALLLTSAVTVLALENGTRPVVNLGYARFEGIANATTGLDYYYGIRYAAPPTGDLRWRAPEAIEGSGVYKKGQLVNATVPAPICFQGYPGWTGITEAILTGASEDCLILNVYVPSKPKNNKLPVALYIHGGGYTLGSVSDGEVPTEYSDGSIIFVSIQYRLGAFGFLSSTDIRDDGVANSGLLDQRAAIEWAHAHISKFGGDPTKITIWGGSAGGGSVMNQLILYGGEANPPFRGAIPEFPWFQPYHNDSILEDQYSEVLAAADCTDLACLRSVSSTVLATANQASFVIGYQSELYAFGDFYYGPAVDGEIIRDLPSNEFKQGHFSKVAMLVDRDGYEGIVFSNSSINTASEVTPDLQILFPFAGPSFFARLYELYPISAFTGAFFDLPFFTNYFKLHPTTTDDSALWQRAAIFGDFIIECPTSYMASALTDRGVPVWKLAFYAGTQTHGATGPFVFEPDLLSPNATIAGIMKDWFLSFVIDLDPNTRSFSGLSKPHWPQFGAAISEGAGQVSTLRAMEVNATNIGIVADPDISDRCDFFQAQSYVVRN